MDENSTFGEAMIACAACKQLPTAACPYDSCMFRQACLDQDDRREIARIMNLSDVELAAEVTRDGKTPESAAAECRAIFERACAIVDARSPEASDRESANG